MKMLGESDVATLILSGQRSGTKVAWTKRTAQPFCRMHSEQIGLVQHPERFDLSALRGIDAEIRALFADPQASAYIPVSRSEKIIEVVTARIQMLEQTLRMGQQEGIQDICF